MPTFLLWNTGIRQRFLRLLGRLSLDGFQHWLLLMQVILLLRDELAHDNLRFRIHRCLSIISLDIGPITLLLNPTIRVGHIGLLFFIYRIFRGLWLTSSSLFTGFVLFSLSGLDLLL